jgi:hypothetical protein
LLRFRQRQLFATKLFKRLQGFGSRHQRRATAHVHRHLQHLHKLGPGTAQLYQRLAVKSQTALATAGNADGQGNQLLGFVGQRTIGMGRTAHLAKALHGVRNFAAEFSQLAAQLLGQTRVVVTHYFLLQIKFIFILYIFIY